MKHYQGVPRYRYPELLNMPTLAVAQMDDLKIETTTLSGTPCRVWLSRAEGRTDGVPFRHTASIELYRVPRGSESGVGAVWESLYDYDADRPSHTSEGSDAE